MFRSHVLIIRRSKFHYTGSGIITPTGGRPVLFNAILTSSWWAHVLETCRDMKWNLLWKKFCASSWLITEINILRCTASKTSKMPLYFSLTTFCHYFPWIWTDTGYVIWYNHTLMHFKVILCSFLTPAITMVIKDPLWHSQLGYKGLYVASPYQGTSVCVWTSPPHPTPKNLTVAHC